jgi:peptidoglycan/LPS O-acetylase OafA/YrhL
VSTIVLRDKIDYLNSLRGIAVLMVIFTHAGLYIQTSLLDSNTRSIIADASRGVQLFYILSAFTLFYSIYSRKGADTRQWRDFFVRRLFRIAPLWWLSIMAFIYIRSQYTFSWSAILSNVFFIHGFNPKYINSIVVGGWSIAVEMNFYLLVPLFYKLCKDLNRTLISFTWIYVAMRLISFAMATANPGVSTTIWAEYLFYYLPHQLPVFFFGFMLFHIIIRKDTKLSPVAIVHAAIFLLLCYSFSKDWFMGQCAMLFPLVWMVSKAPHVKLWNNKVLQYLGKISFGLYLVHFGAVLLVKESGVLAYITQPHLQFATGWLLVTALATGIATLTYRLVEKPCIALGNKLIERLESRKILY